MTQLEFQSNRSAVYGLHGSVSTSQPLASDIGLSVLKSGGNSVDACIAMAAALTVVEPCSTGIGGDAFALVYLPSSAGVQARVEAVNGSGRSSRHITSEDRLSLSAKHLRIPVSHGLAVTVPGTVACWIDTLERYGSGRMSLQTLVKPAIDLARNGFAVSPIVSHIWKEEEEKLKGTKNGLCYLRDGKSPEPGDIMKFPLYAKTLEKIASCGKDGFYNGEVAEAIVEVVQRHGGKLDAEDLKAHESAFCSSVSVKYGDLYIHQCPPNGQGIVALIALGIYQQYRAAQTKELREFEILHVKIESMRIAFHVASQNVGDNDNVDLIHLLSANFHNQLAAMISLETTTNVKGSFVSSSDTVYLCAADRSGQSCSFINSTYMGFGSGLVPNGCGFSLHNRGCNFLLKNDPEMDGAEHPNILGPSKRPYHTLMPSMVTDSTGGLVATFGVMGAFMQPQGQMQVFLNLFEKSMNPQTALDLPRFCLGVNPRQPASEWITNLEVGLNEECISRLKKIGHRVNIISGHARSLFGRGQVIRKLVDKKYGETVWCAGSDPRGDGCSLAC